MRSARRSIQGLDPLHDAKEVERFAPSNRHSVLGSAVTTPVDIENTNGTTNRDSSALLSRYVVGQVGKLLRS